MKYTLRKPSLGEHPPSLDLFRVECPGFDQPRHIGNFMPVLGAVDGGVRTAVVNTIYAGKSPVLSNW
jgi:hypothetical protein